VPWNTIGCPPIKMEVFGRILAKKQKIEGSLREIEKKSRGMANKGFLVQVPLIVIEGNRVI